MKVCKRGHERLDRELRCAVCDRLNAAARRAADPEKIRAAEAASRARAGKDGIAARNKRFRLKDPERKSAATKKWYSKDPARNIKRALEWRKANPEKVKQNEDAWRAANAPKLAAQQRAYILTLPPAYIAAQLKIPVAQLTPELLALKREQLLVHRLARAMKKALKENT